MKDMFTNEVFIGLITACFGGFMTYLGVSRKSKNDAMGIYTAEIRHIILELKAQNAEKDKEISRLEKIAEKLQKQLDRSTALLNRLQEKEKEYKAELDAKNKKIVELLEKMGGK